VHVYSSSDSSAWTDALQTLRERVGQSAALETAGAIVARTLYEHFAAATALVRVYAVVPYEVLDSEVTRFVDALAQTTNQAERIGPRTPVLTLLGTHGAKEEWCDRRKSVGHRGIPLASEEFVQAIPMVAQLLKELGVDLTWLDRAPDVNARRLLGGFNGVFYVDDARTARDTKGRLIIPAQDFVAEQEVKTVFGMGGFYPDGTLLTIIVFAREHLERAHVERLTSLISLFKGETFGVVRAKRFFS
jgi:hypothetical protein